MTQLQAENQKRCWVKAKQGGGVKGDIGWRDLDKWIRRDWEKGREVIRGQCGGKRYEPTAELKSHLRAQKRRESGGKKWENNTEQDRKWAGKDTRESGRRWAVRDGRSFSLQQLVMRLLEESGSELMNHCNSLAESPEGSGKKNRVLVCFQPSQATRNYPADWEALKFAVDYIFMNFHKTAPKFPLNILVFRTQCLFIYTHFWLSLKWSHHFTMIRDLHGSKVLDSIQQIKLNQITEKLSKQDWRIIRSDPKCGRPKKRVG